MGGGLRAVMASENERNNGLFSQSLDRLKESFLFAAAQGGNSQDVQSLLDIGADIDWRGQGGDTSLLAACRRGHCDTMAMLAAYGSNVNAVANDGSTCLHIAARRGDIASLNVLLEMDCDIAAKDKEGRSALDIARTKGHTDIAARLVQFQRTGNSSTTSGGGSLGSRGIRDIVRQAQSEDKAVAAAVIASPRGRNLPSLSNPAAAAVGAQSRPGQAATSSAAPTRGESSKFTEDSKDTLISSISTTSAIASALGVDLNSAPAQPKQTPSQSNTTTTTTTTTAAAAAAAGAKAEAGALQRAVPAPMQTYALIGSAYTDATTNALSKLLEAEQRERKQSDARVATLTAENSRLEQDLSKTLDEASMLASELACVTRELDLLKGKKSALEAPSVTLETCVELDRVLKTALENVEARKSTLMLSSIVQQQEQRLCVVCQEKDKSVVLLPCRHLCLCEICSSHDDLSHCPLCRRPIAHRISVFA